jgi:hypothetical protein
LSRLLKPGTDRIDPSKKLTSPVILSGWFDRSPADIAIIGTFAALVLC